jgi:hypothetical protein
MATRSVASLPRSGLCLHRRLSPVLSNSYAEKPGEKPQTGRNRPTAVTREGRPAQHRHARRDGNSELGPGFGYGPAASGRPDSPPIGHQRDANSDARSAKQANRVAIITALVGLAAAVITLGAAVVPLLENQIDHLHRQVAAQQSTIGNQRKQIGHLKAAQAVPDAPEGGNYLSNLSPVTNLYSAQAGPVVIGGVSYPDSVTFQCNGTTETGVIPLTYQVTGSAFTTVIGYGDGAASGYQNVTATVTITDQNGRILGDRVEVTPGHPLQVHLPLTGISQIGFTCTAVDTATGSGPPLSPSISLANAATS